GGRGRHRDLHLRNRPARSRHRQPGASNDDDAAGRVRVDSGTRPARDRDADGSQAIEAGIAGMRALRLLAGTAETLVALMVVVALFVGFSALVLYLAGRLLPLAGRGRRKD